MRATITVERKRSFPSSFLVAGDAVKLLQSLPGVSEIRVERAGPMRAVISYTWRPDDNVSIGEALENSGMQIAA
jgi:hypothetical protein